MKSYREYVKEFQQQTTCQFFFKSSVFRVHNSSPPSNRLDGIYLTYAKSMQGFSWPTNLTLYLPYAVMSINSISLTTSRAPSGEWIYCPKLCQKVHFQLIGNRSLSTKSRRFLIIITPVLWRCAVYLRQVRDVILKFWKLGRQTERPADNVMVCSSAAWISRLVNVRSQS